MRSLVMWAALLVSVGACASPAPSPSASASAAPSSPSAAAARELVDGPGPLPPGRYEPRGSRPPVTFEVADGWSGGPARDGYLAISHALADGTVVELVIADVIGPDDAATAAGRLQTRSDVLTLAASGSRMSGLEGHNLEIENMTAARVDLLTTPFQSIDIERRGRLWLSLFDTSDGLLAIAVGSPAATWDEALAVVEPVLESVAIGD